MSGAPGFRQRQWTKSDRLCDLLVSYGRKAAPVAFLNVVDDKGNVVGHLEFDMTVAAIVKQESRHTTEAGKFRA